MILVPRSNCQVCSSLDRYPQNTGDFCTPILKVTGDSLLIHELLYSLFIGLCLVTSNMTDYSHSYHSIKLIHCSVPQRDVLSDPQNTGDFCTPILKVTGDSLLIHELAYSLFIGLCSVTCNMTDYSHSYHSIKLIHCGALQRDVLSDKMVL